MSVSLQGNSHITPGCAGVASWQLAYGQRQTCHAEPVDRADVTLTFAGRRTQHHLPESFCPQGPVLLVSSSELSVFGQHGGPLVSLMRIFGKAVKLGILDGQGPSNPNPYSKLGAEAVDTPAHRSLALEGAKQGIVLLKNEERTLPMRPAEVGRLALIGPHANSSLIFLGGPNYHGDSSLVYEYTPLLRARAKLPNAEVSYSQGCSVSGADKSGFAAAVSAAQAADRVVLFLGSDQTIENEGHDRDTLDLPGVQQQLALAVAEAASVPVVVVLVNGGTISVRSLKESAKVGAIVEAFLPGQYGAEAVISTILGETSPAGLLPVTVYDSGFVDRRAITNLDLRAAGGVTYRYFDGVPLWPFGFGLSYTEFTFSGDRAATLTTTVARADSKPLCFDVDVSNAPAGVASDIVVLGFISSAHADAPRNGKLCDFVRESNVAPGEQRTVKICATKALSLVDDDGNERVLPGRYTVTVGVAGGVGGTGAGSTVGTVIVTSAVEES